MAQGLQGPAAIAQWRSPTKCRDHFLWHGSRLRVTTVSAYDQSARATIQRGTRFTYTDVSAGTARVGYFEPGNGRFTALSADEAWILTHFRATEHYVRTRPDSDYP